ncbi:hypothetical protein ACFQU2_24550 [Siccirubricoccus deserti]
MLLGALLLALTGRPAVAAWPERPITAIVPFAPGGGTDGVARSWPTSSAARWASRW